jgi:hypothetical protein
MKLCRLFWLLTAAALTAREPVPPGGSVSGFPEGEAVETLLEDDAQTAQTAEPASDEVPVREPEGNLIPESYRQDYFAERPEKFLIDPQKLLGPVGYRERLAFLNYHASDSSIDLFVYLIGGDQLVPGGFRHEQMMEQLFSKGRPAVVVLYFMSAPQRTMLLLSPSLTDVVPAAEQRRALESSVIPALKEIEPARQLETFLVQMSIRIYWLERMMAGGEPDKQTSAAPVIKAAEKSGLREWLRPHLEQASRHMLPACALATVSLLAFATRCWLKRRARYRFPDFEVEPRLGGAHAAGVGAVISFANATVPPATQRDAMPEYLRRA